MAQDTSSPPDVYSTAKAGALRGSKALVLRHVLVATISLAGTTALVRLIGAADWAVAAQGYFLVVFLDYALGANLLGGLLHRTVPLTQRDVEAAARLASLSALALIALGAALAVPAALVLGRAEWGLCMLAVGVGGAVFAVRSVPVALLERDLRYRRIAAAEVLDQVTFYVLAVPAAALGAGLPAVLAALALRSVPSAIAVFRAAPAPLIGTAHRAELRALLDFARPTAGSAGLVLLDGLLPLLVLGGSHDAELAFMLTAATIAGYAATLQVVAQRVGFTSLARLQDDAQRFGHAIGRAATVATVVIVAAILPIAGLGSIWLPLLFGDSWADATWVMAWLGVAMLMQSPVNLATAVLNARGRPRSVLVLRVVQTVPYAAVAFALVASDALLAAPIGAAAGRGVAALLSAVLLRRMVTLPTLGWLVGVPSVAGGATLGMTALCVDRPEVAVLATVGALLTWTGLNWATVLTLRRSLGSSA